MSITEEQTNYELETTGTLMKDEFIAIKNSFNVKQAMRQVRERAKIQKNLHYLYVIDESGKLIGAMSLRKLLAAEGEQNITEVMESVVVALPVDMDQEEAAKVFQDTDFVSMPVIEDEKLVGVIHVEDILDVMEQETTEDFYKMASVTKELDGGLLNAPLRLMYRKRVVWLVVLVFMNIFSGAGIAHFEDVIENNIALVFFLPLLVDSGGNAGSQSATLVIRAMATGDIRIRDWFKMFSKELIVAAGLGFTMALAVSGIGLYRGGMEIAFVVALTMVVIVIVGSLIGMSLPFIFSKLKLDAATASTPLITSICDIAGVLIYFGIAAWVLTL